MATPELSGVSIVGAGAFNPAIVHPSWLVEKGLIPQNVGEHALEPAEGRAMIVSPQVSSFVADWLIVQVTQTQAVFSTVDQARELDLRDLAKGFFNLLPETPVDGIGINADSHFRTDSEEAWHAFGDQFLPKEFWEPLFQGDTWKARAGGMHVGMRVMTVEVYRDDAKLPGYVRVELAPSVRTTPNGVYVGINAHFQLTQQKDRRAKGGDAARVLDSQWSEVRALEADLASALAKAV